VAQREGSSRMLFRLYHRLDSEVHLARRLTFINVPPVPNSKHFDLMTGRIYKIDNAEISYTIRYVRSTPESLIDPGGC
jgi:hypothetical protein